LISARLHRKEKGYGKEYDHLAIIVIIDDLEYITDVGYGEFAFHPLAIEKNTLQQDPRGEFIMDDYQEGYIRIHVNNG
jgi:N-hydroxyarylamine O-acetyltransferase